MTANIQKEKATVDVRHVMELGYKTKLTVIGLLTPSVNPTDDEPFEQDKHRTLCRANRNGDIGIDGPQEPIR